MREPPTHLYWAWQSNPRLIRGITTGVALCGERGMPKDQLTVIPKYCTCRECKTALRNAKLEAIKTETGK